MRTALTIDEDLAVRVQDLRRRHGYSLKQVIIRLLREGLRSRQQPPDGKPYRTKTHKLGLRSGFDAGGFNQLVDELEAEEHQKSGEEPHERC